MKKFLAFDKDTVKLLDQQNTQTGNRLACIEEYNDQSHVTTFF